MFRLDKVYEGWSFERVFRHIIYWGFWTLFYPTVNLEYKEGAFAQWLSYELIVDPVKLIYCYFVIYVLMPKYLYKRRYANFFLWVLICGIAAGFTTTFLDINVITPVVFNDEYLHSTLDFKVVYKILDQMQIAAFVVIIKFVQRQFQQEKSAQVLARQKLDAELKLLKNQLQPHFLFNTLNNLYGMVLTNHEKTADLIIRLSDMLSYMLYECNDTYVPLEKEIRILNNYVELEKIRYGSKLNVDFAIKGELASKKVAPLLFFPLLENAFKHGPAKLEKETYVIVELMGSKDDLMFKVVNQKSTSLQTEKDVIRSGVGLENVKSRLKLLYPDRHDLQIYDKNDTFTVTLSLKDE